MSRGQELRQLARSDGLACALQVLRNGADDACPQAQDVLWLLLGVSERLRDATVQHLRTRRSGDTTVLLQQMVRGQLAEALGEQLEVQEAITALHPPSDPVVARLHRRITDTDRALLRCYGAAGFLADGVGGEAMDSETLLELG